MALLFSPHLFLPRIPPAVTVVHASCMWVPAKVPTVVSIFATKQAKHAALLAMRTLIACREPPVLPVSASKMELSSSEVHAI